LTSRIIEQIKKETELIKKQDPSSQTPNPQGKDQNELNQIYINQIMSQLTKINKNGLEDQNLSDQADLNKQSIDCLSPSVDLQHQAEITSDQKFDEESGQNGATQRKRREIYKCPHTDRKHYAKNMCHNCYHRKGKTKMAYACGHTHKSHYSSGMCQNCYLAKYYIKRKNKTSDKNSAKEGSVENLVNSEQKAISKTSDQSE